MRVARHSQQFTRRYLASLAVTSVSLLAVACQGPGRASKVDAGTARLTVEVTAPRGVEVPPAALDGDRLLVALAADSWQWPSGPFDQRVRCRFSDRSGTAIFDELPVGSYAVIAFLDLDGDGELDRGAFGVPIEPIAYGNDAVPRLGPPAFKSCLVEVGPGSTKTRITLRFE